jgi:hypothetical protein
MQNCIYTPEPESWRWTPVTESLPDLGERVAGMRDDGYWDAMYWWPTFGFRDAMHIEQKVVWWMRITKPQTR